MSSQELGGNEKPLEKIESSQLPILMPRPYSDNGPISTIIIALHGKATPNQTSTILRTGNVRISPSFQES